MGYDSGILFCISSVNEIKTFNFQPPPPPHPRGFLSTSTQNCDTHLFGVSKKRSKTSLPPIKSSPSVFLSLANGGDVHCSRFVEIYFETTELYQHVVCFLVVDPDFFFPKLGRLEVAAREMHGNCYGQCIARIINHSFAVLKRFLKQDARLPPGYFSLQLFLESALNEKSILHQNWSFF